MNDGQLLREYVQTGSHAAFAEVMNRHADLVYAAARRQVADRHLAEDVTQAVFIILARKAKSLTNYPTIAGWLVRTAHFAASDALRRERRLARREETASTMAQQQAASSADESQTWEEIKPLLDQGIARLRSGDRDAIALRYLQSKSLAEVAAALGTSEPAAAKRVSRAVERLREYMNARGLTVQSSMLGGLIASHGYDAAPAALRAVIASASAGKASALSMSISKGAMIVMNGMKLKAAGIAIAAALLIASGGGLVWYEFNQSGVIPIPSQIFAARDGSANLADGWTPNAKGQTATAGAVDRQGHTWIATEEHGLWMNSARADHPAQWEHILLPNSDDCVYSVAADAQGRVWAGTLRSGVFVFNGSEWKNYDATNGPLGQHIARIAVCPAGCEHGAGNVWIASDLGLARYLPDQDDWQLLTRAQGLASDQATSMSFDLHGNIYVGTLCDGLMIGQAGDNFKTWRTIGGPDERPTASAGPGLPCATVNDVLVTHAGAILVATPSGLAISKDSGETFSFIRGKDWIEKVKNSIAGPPKDWKPDGEGVLSEDYVSCLAEDSAGQIWLGYRRAGCGTFNPQTMAFNAVAAGAQTDYCTMIMPMNGFPPLIGTRGLGLRQAPGSTDARSMRQAPAQFQTPALPSSILPPDANELRAMAAQVRSLNDAPAVAYLGEDWITQGDWVGRYGREQAAWPYYMEFFTANMRFRIDDVFTGPHHSDDAGKSWYYFGSLDSKSPKAPWAPGRGRRIIGEWNDGGWQGNKFGVNWEGPDLWFHVAVPEGINRISLYFAGGGYGLDRSREYPVEIRKFTGHLKDDQAQPVLARAHFPASLNAVYKSFLLPGGQYWIRVASNYSHMAALTAMYLDQADITAPQQEDGTTHELGEGSRYDPPAVAADGRMSDVAIAATDLWSALDQAWIHGSSVTMQMPYRILAYRAAASAGAPASMLARWRWVMHLWTPEDRSEFQTVMDKAWQKRKAATQAATQSTQPSE